MEPTQTCIESSAEFPTTEELGIVTGYNNSISTCCKICRSRKSGRTRAELSFLKQVQETKRIQQNLTLKTPTRTNDAAPIGHYHEIDLTDKNKRKLIHFINYKQQQQQQQRKEAY
jgi:hypothetical protein